MAIEHKFSIKDKKNDKVYKYTVKDRVIYCDKCVVDSTSCQHVVMAICNKKIKRIIGSKVSISELQIKNIFKKTRL